MNAMNSSYSILIISYALIISLWPVAGESKQNHWHGLYEEKMLDRTLNITAHDILAVFNKDVFFGTYTR